MGYENLNKDYLGYSKTDYFLDNITEEKIEDEYYDE